MGLVMSTSIFPQYSFEVDHYMFVCVAQVDTWYWHYMYWYYHGSYLWYWIGDYHGTMVCGISITMVFTHGIDLDITMAQVFVVLGYPWYFLEVLIGDC